MRRILNFIAAALLLIATATVTQAQIDNKKSLTLDGANQVIAAAKAEAKRLNAPGGVIAVVDEGGNLMALERLDGTFTAGANISIGKAKTAVMFKRPTKFFEDVIKNGRTAMVALPDFTPLQGGVPIEYEGQIIGGVGVSGASSAQQDEQLAIAGANAFKSGGTNTTTASKAITYFDSRQVAAAFVKGASLIDGSNGVNYMVNPSRRDKPGVVEVHALDTDIIYVTEGSATLVTGGEPVDAKTIAANEIRAASVTGASETRRLSKGDVVVIPAGVPHWFKEVKGTFLYYVVKVR
ncbi:MAG TPA: heme-binding protein [Pyrinomonadaceae bacterium]|nr:heme-binding protein [Pyrinomonadaceae bacterium]